MRQSSATIIQTTNNKRRYGTVIIPTDFNNETAIRTTSIDRLDRIALDFYQDASLWWVIAAANGIGKGTLLVPVNTKLIIPSINTVNQIITNYNASR